MKNFIKGIIYGIFSITPGLSGGLLAIKLGDYNRIINIISNKEYKKNNILYLFKIIIGFIVGTIIFSNIIHYFYIRFTYLFEVIIILLSIYLLISFIVKIKLSFLRINIIFIISLIIYFILININFTLININLLFLFFISGVIFSFSKIIPGLSGTTILINIGFYKYLLKFFSNPFTMFSNITLWFIFWLTFIISSLFIIKYICTKNDLLNYIAIIIMVINIFILINN